MTTIPDGLRPAQLGVILVGRPVLGHASATLVSLARRGLVTATETDGSWRLGPGSVAGDRDGYEQALLSGLPSSFGLTSLPEQVAPALRRFADDLVRDAVRRGSLRRLHHDRRTPRGEELAARARGLRARLRTARTSGDPGVIGELLEYAIVFGLLRDSQEPLARFAAAFTAACSDLPGWRHPEHHRGETGGPDFTRDEFRGMGLGGAAIMSGGIGF